MVRMASDANSLSPVVIRGLGRTGRVVCMCSEFGERSEVGSGIPSVRKATLRSQESLRSDSDQMDGDSELGSHASYALVQHNTSNFSNLHANMRVERQTNFSITSRRQEVVQETADAPATMHQSTHTKPTKSSLPYLLNNEYFIIDWH